MKLEEWPLQLGPNEDQLCGMETCVGLLIGDTFGELAQCIVEHAREDHGIELERSGCWYRSRTSDGEVWSESSNVDDYGPVDLDGMEGEELEHFAKRNEIEKTLTYERIEFFMIGVLDPGWKPGA